ncbi:MAG: chemotaxis protein CheX [Planctomycetales bacterium]|nr:chemotaxis protein CheX [Planctomycetales bacterium]
MKAEHINPFLVAVSNTFSTMLDCEARRGEIALVSSGTKLFPISGVIGLSGMAAGTVVINLSKEVALKAASAMLMMNITEINDDVIDAVGEIANMVAGQAKAELEEYNLSVSLPNVVTGEDHAIRFPSDAKPIGVAFDTDFGPLRLEVGLEPIAQTAGA